jgi:hypothetical protein
MDDDFGQRRRAHFEAHDEMQLCLDSKKTEYAKTSPHRRFLDDVRWPGSTTNSKSN